MSKESRVAGKRSAIGAVEAPPVRRRIGVVVVDALPVVRAGLTLLIDGRPEMEVLGEAGSPDEALDATAKLRRSQVVVIVGLGLTGEHDSFWLIRNLRERFPTHTILGCGANADAGVISRALFVGADGYIDKNVDPVEFLQAIRRSSEKEMVLTGPAGVGVARIVDGIEQRRELDVRLTERERQVLAVAAEGLTARQIALRLGVKERTITTHLARIYGKLGVGNRLSAIRLAARSGLVSVGGRD